jgi:hypothetical protein
MYEVRQESADAQDRKQLDNRWQEDISWIEEPSQMSFGEMPSRGDRWLEAFERNPMLWSVIILGMGSLAFILMTILIE